ncbi:hypothetical protein [Candidatus Thiodiazotropha sp. CDECU1]|uniref:hypothetical protein n=1 Tax=Candidatus Thiodiazotropha sp. CDECU1 TaxID=3065865 RepID=UPI00292E8991|nr:hypothetical protein [Candidatus Thiodiazotropha sp. CDECU1]
MGNRLSSGITGWCSNKYDKREDSEDYRIAFAGGQGIIMLDLDLDDDVHYFTAGAVYESQLTNFSDR